MSHTQSFELGDFKLQSGRLFPNLELKYGAYGELNETRTNAIILNTPFAAGHTELEWLLGPDGVFDTDRYFVIIPSMFGNGVSSSPTNCSYRDNDGRWPLITIYDNVVAQHRLLTEIGVSEVALACGWSMGGMQAYQWASLYPEITKRLAVICGAGRVSAHNYVFLEGVKTALRYFERNDSDTCSPEDIEQSLRAVGRIYAGWALSQAFYREEVWRSLGFSTLESFIIGYWEEGFLKRHPSNLLAHIRTWQAADISANNKFNGNFERALGSIEAQTLLIPCQTDLYFPVEDNAYELNYLNKAELIAIPSIWGHRAGNPVSSPADMAFLKDAINGLLALPNTI